MYYEPIADFEEKGPNAVLSKEDNYDLVLSVSVTSDLEMTEPEPLLFLTLLLNRPLPVAKSVVTGNQVEKIYR